MLREFAVKNARCFTRTNGTQFVSADVTINGVTIYGMSVVQGKNGDFLSFPQRQGKDGNWYSVCWARLAADDQAKIIAEIERQINESGS